MKIISKNLKERALDLKSVAPTDTGFAFLKRLKKESLAKTIAAYFIKNK